jgi:hypothetical protein
MIGRAAGFITAISGKELEEETKEISRMIWGLIRHYEKKEETSNS